MAENTEYGKPLKGLNTKEGATREMENQGYNEEPMVESYASRMRRVNKYSPVVQPIGYVGVGDSIYDEEMISATQIENLEDSRGQLQSGIAKIGAGLAKGAILAGTTFLDGTFGLLAGGAAAIKENRISALWDNPFSKALQDVNQWAEKALPNYYTDAEKEGPWYDNIFTANFIGDKFIKNLGFTVGAFYSGGLTSGLTRGLATGAMKGAKALGASINTIKNISKTSSMVAGSVGALTSAVNEGRIEALNNSTDWFNYNKAKLDDNYISKLNSLGQDYTIDENGDIHLRGPISSEAFKLTESYDSVIGKLTEDRLKMGNADLLFNTVLLSASNILQFGKMYANGFKTARKANNIIGKPGEYVAAGSRGLGMAKAALNPFSEGFEEVAQSAASNIAGNYYETDVNNFYKAKLDPEAEQQTLSWIKAAAKGINDTINDGSSAEEFFIGWLTGALGMPVFGKANTQAEDVYAGRNKVLGLKGGFIGEWKEYNEGLKRDAEIARRMNERVQSPEFLNYYQGLIRHNKYQNDMNQAVEANDEFEFKNAEHAQLVSDIAMFDNAGKLEYLKTLVSSTFDISDENLESIVENTTSKAENGDLVGPFAEYAVKNDDGTISANFGSESSKQDMISKLTKNRDDILNTIDQYQSIKDDIDIRTGQQLSNEQLEELTWLKSQIGNWQERASQLSSEIKPTINTVLGRMSQLADVYSTVKNEEGKAHAGLSDLYKKADRDEKQLRENMSLLETIRGLDDKTFSNILASDPKLVNGIKTVIEGGLDDIDIETINNKIDDVVKLTNATKKYSTKLKEYLDNPIRLQEDLNFSKEDIITKETQKKANNLKARLNTSKDLADFRNILSEESDDALVATTLKDLEEESNSLVKDYKEVSSYNRDIQNILNSSDEAPTIRADAAALFRNQYNKASNLNEVANPNSIYIDDPEVLYDDSLTEEENISKFQEAKYALQRAMSKANNDQKFKDRFSKEYKELKTEGTPNPSAPSTETTGDSGTSTVPSVNETSTVIPERYEPPVGDISLEQLDTENSQLNDMTVSKVSDPNEKNFYYRPAIPEIHIEASKGRAGEADFRPFDQVVAEREKGVDFSVIYNYLDNAGAFKYVNEGNLKVGDDIGFMIDPSLEEKMKVYSWYKGPTILLIDKKNNQVVGSLDESEKSVPRYEGLNRLREIIKSEFNNSNVKDGKFIATPTTKVSKIMIGKIPYGTEERSLADIPNVSEDGKTSIFGIIQNGRMTTNDQISDRLLIKPLDMTNKEGRLYLYIPNGSGTYSPVAVRVKHFNNTEFNLNDVTVSNTPIGKTIKEALVKLSNATNQDEVSEAMRDLASNIYLRDVMITWFEGQKGNGVVISKKVRNSDGSYVKTIINNKEQIKEDKVSIYFSSITSEVDDLGSPIRDYKDPNDIYNEILNHLASFNLPLQVSSKSINSGNYNNRLISSNILTSNLTSAKVISNWFSMDYIDKEGNIRKAINPSSKIRAVEKYNPVDGIESVVDGTPISLNNIQYYVDLTSNTIKDNNGKTIESLSNDQKQLLLDLAWAQSNYGDTRYSVVMWNNKILTPSGKVLDRTTNKYLEGAEAQKVKDKIAGREKVVQNSNLVLASIAEDQKNINRERTDDNHYYISEIDGQYYEYNKVHTNLGVTSPQQTPLQRTVKNIVRQFFTSNTIPTKPDTIEEKAFNTLIGTLTELRSNIEARGERFLTNDIVIYKDYPDGTRVAGEPDILSVDSYGDFRMYKIKIDSKPVDNVDSDTLELSTLKSLFESKYNTPVTSLGILPFVINSSNNKINSINKEKGILVSYNPNINIPNTTSQDSSSANSSTPIFNSALEIKDPINRVLPENSFDEGGTVGYYEKDGNIYKGYLKSIGNIEGVEIYLTKERDKGYGKEGQFNKSSNYYVIFPNGKFVNTNTLGMSDDKAAEVIMGALKVKPQKVKDLASEKTLISESISIEPVQQEVKNETPSNILSSSTTGAAKATQVEQAVNKKKASRMKHVLRKVDNTTRNIWNQEKELAWINKVLPQLSREDRIKVIKGLIRVGNQGTLAWGQFSNGIITLSDAAAEGTVYHEAFHVVFNLLLDNNERQALLAEAKEMYGEKSDLDLEEDMAEGFREYVISRDTTGILNKIKNFFKDLWIKVSNWKRLQPHLIAYYQMINEGKYSTSDFKISSIKQEQNTQILNSVDNTFESLDLKIQEELLNMGWTQKQFDSISQAERNQAVKCLGI